MAVPSPGASPWLVHRDVDEATPIVQRLVSRSFAQLAGAAGEVGAAAERPARRRHSEVARNLLAQVFVAGVAEEAVRLEVADGVSSAALLGLLESELVMPDWMPETLLEAQAGALPEVLTELLPQDFLNLPCGVMPLSGRRVAPGDAIISPGFSYCSDVWLERPLQSDSARDGSHLPQADASIAVGAAIGVSAVLEEDGSQLPQTDAIIAAGASVGVPVVFEEDGSQLLQTEASSAVGEAEGVGAALEKPDSARGQTNKAALEVVEARRDVAIDVAVQEARAVLSALRALDAGSEAPRDRNEEATISNLWTSASLFEYSEAGASSTSALADDTTAGALSATAEWSAHVLQGLGLGLGLSAAGSPAMPGMGSTTIARKLGMPTGWLATPALAASPHSTASSTASSLASLSFAVALVPACGLRLRPALQGDFSLVGSSVTAVPQLDFSLVHMGDSDDEEDEETVAGFGAAGGAAPTGGAHGWHGHQEACSMHKVPLLAMATQPPVPQQPAAQARARLPLPPTLDALRTSLVQSRSMPALLAPVAHAPWAHLPQRCHTPLAARRKRGQVELRALRLPSLPRERAGRRQPPQGGLPKARRSAGAASAAGPGARGDHGYGYPGAARVQVHQHVHHHYHVFKDAGQA